MRFRVPVALLLIFNVLVADPPVIAPLILSVSAGPTLIVSAALVVLLKASPPESVLPPVPLSMSVLPLLSVPAPLKLIAKLPANVAVLAAVTV